MLGTLPTGPTGESHGGGYPVDFSIVGSRAGWLKIANADDSKNEEFARPVFNGTGWIEGRAARIGIQSGRG